MNPQEASARRNRALRKIRSCRSVPLETKAVIETLIDLLARPSNYQVAWPSARNIGDRIGRSERTVRWHLRAIRTARIFTVLHLSPAEAMDHCERHYGFKPKLDRVRRQSPPLYSPNEEHWLWSKAMRVSAGEDKALGETIRAVLARRNRHKVIAPQSPRGAATPAKPRYPDLEGVWRRMLAMPVVDGTLDEFLIDADEDLEDVVDDHVPDVVDDSTWGVVDASQEK